MKRSKLFILIILLPLQACAFPSQTSQTEAERISSAAQATLSAEAEVTALAATATFTHTPSPTVTLTATPQPTSTLIPANAEVAAACVPLDTPAELGIVINIIDGYTIEVLIDGVVFPVRYIGIKTIRVEASAVNAALVYNQIVRLVRDVSDKDKSGYLLRYVFVGDLFINYVLLRQGYATAAPSIPDITCAYTFSAAEQEARALGAGLWAP